MDLKIFAKKALVSVATQNASTLLKEINVDLGHGFYLTYEEPSESSKQYAFDITKRNMEDLYNLAPEWGWNGKILK